MHNPESVQENEMHISFCDFDILMDHLISARVSDCQKKKKKR